MKVNKIVNLCIIIILSAAVYSCGDDTITNTNPTTPVGSVLYSKDTLEAFIEPGLTNMVNGIITNFNQNVGATKLKVEYRIQSNADSSLGIIASYNDSTNGSPVPPSPITVNIYESVDIPVEFTTNVVVQPFYANFDLNIMIGSQPSAIRRYIRFVDIKVTKVQ